jgi:hypothetical protein
MVGSPHPQDVIFIDFSPANAETSESVSESAGDSNTTDERRPRPR